MSPLKTCEHGHQFFKSSDCPVCPICDKKIKPSSGFLALLVGPARRALEAEGISDLETLSKYTEKDLLNLHGFGPATLPTLRAELAKKGLEFKSKSTK